VQKPKRIKDDRSLMQDGKPQGRKGTLAIKPDKLAARVARKTKGRRVDEKYKNPLP